MIALRLALIALVLLTLLAAPVGVGAQEEPSAPLPSSQPADTPADQPPDAPAGAGGGGGLNVLPDPKVWAAEVFTTVVVTLLGGIAAALKGVVGAVMGSALNFVSQTPPGGTYASPTVQALSGGTRAIANAGLVLVVLWGGLNLIVREHVRAPYHDALELVPRVLVGALLVNRSDLWVRFTIDFNNALCQAVGQTSLPAWERADAASQVLTDLIATLVYLVTGLLLLLQMLGRLALIDVLIVAAPLALLGWVLPQTQGVAWGWWRAFSVTVFAQFGQVLTLKLGASLLTELQPMAADAAVLALFLGVAVMALTLRVPGLMRADAPSGLGAVRYHVYRLASAAAGPARAAGAARGGR